MSRLTLSLFGGFEATYEGKNVREFRSNKIRALLAFLAVESGRPHARDSLATLLWPEMSSSDARRNLRNSLSRLRRSLGNPLKDRLLDIGRQQVQLDDGYLDLDVRNFRRLLAETAGHDDEQELCPECALKLGEAAGLYRGEFLAGFYLEDAPEFNEWALWQREGYHEELLQGLHKLVLYHEAAGEYRQAQIYAGRQVALEPWREEAHRQLMRLLAKTGQRTSALAQYERVEEVLAAELGVSPATATVELYEAIRDGRFPETKREEAARATAVAHNLPRSFTTFVGRETEVAGIGQRLATPACALLTLIGPGGSGKTRLAVEVARQQAPNYQDGAWLVSLAPVAEAQDLPVAIADALGISLSGSVPAATQVANYLQAKELLLVVDNFEHLLPGAPFLLELLQRAERLQLLVTSRLPLHLRAEWLYAVDGLPVPGSDDEATTREAPAGRLFLDRMRQRWPRFVPEPAETAAVAHLCRLLDGMPLAIELAAARAEPGQIGELEEAVAANLDVLATSMQDVPHRQRSLRAMFDYSWQLLAAGERQALAGLSVFHDPFTTEAAREVAGSAATVLAGLAEKSLLRSPQPGRYELHSVIGQYARDALAGMPAGPETVQARHSAYYLGLLAGWEQALAGPEQGERLAQMARVLDDVRAAWQWALAQANVPALAAAGTALFQFFNRRSRFREGARLFAQAAAAAREEGAQTLALAAFLGRESYFRRRLGEQETALRLAEESVALATVAGDGNAVRAFALSVLATVSSQRGEHEAAVCYLEEALALYRALDDEAGIASTLNTLGTIASHRGAYQRALRYYEDSLKRQQVLGDRELMAACYNNMGIAHYYLGDLGKTAELFEKSLAIRGEIGDRQGEAKLLNNLGVLLLNQERVEEAAAHFEKSRAAHAALGVQRGLAISLLHLGEIALVREDPTRAEALLAQAMAQATAVGATLVMLEVVVALGRLAGQEGDAARAVALLSLVAAHPQAKADTRAEAQELLGEIEGALSPEGRAAARERGRRLTLAGGAADVATQREAD